MKYGYNIANVEHILGRMSTSYTSPNAMRRECQALQRELDGLFKDRTCKEVMFTDNKDQLFFGMCVMPIIDPEKANKIIFKDDEMVIDTYALDIDSKLFTIGLTTRELTAVLLHEIGHLVTNDIPVKEVRKKIDLYLTKEHETIDPSQAAKCSPVLAFGIQDTLMKLVSIFAKPDKETTADSFVLLCGYGSDLESALSKLTNAQSTLLNGVSTKPRYVIWDWCYRLHKDIGIKRISAIHTLNKTKQISSSNLEKAEMDKLIRFLRDGYEDAIKESVLGLNEGKTKLGFINSLKYGNIRMLEDDLYELKIRAKAANEQDEALQVLRQINTRMSILKDYCSLPQLSESDRQHWTDVYMYYADLRDYLGNKRLWERKNYGLFFDYNALDRGEDPYHGMEYRDGY